MQKNNTMNLKELTTDQLSDLLFEVKKELDNRKNSIENILSDFSIQEYKSLLARLTLFYNFSETNFKVSEEEIMKGSSKRSITIVKNALTCVLLDKGLSHVDVSDEFNLTRGVTTGRTNYHIKHYMVNKNYTKIYDTISEFFKD
jgi:hypothetical protein